MRAVVQRIRDGSVTVDHRITGEIESGLLVYLGVGEDDTEDDVVYIAEKIAHLRIFPDDMGVMNRSVMESGGGILLISQFTLYGDIRRGRRPSYSHAARPETAQKLYMSCANAVQAFGIPVKTGVFQAMMEVRSINDGPVTILLDSKKKF
ncbi:MAG: D-tyrosyl-tRNA(Tyr) deacylase [Spirochaetaceae bacterium]|nr:MAG: D-tyrosyl-tRNA(Tyr) deacylase [Spirochaetaceae bacterium]